MLKTKIIFITVLIACAAIAGLYEGGYLDFLSPYSFKEYKSERDGYTLNYPRNWRVDDSREKALLDVFYNANKNAVIFVQVFSHESYMTESGRKKAVEDMKKDFQSREEYRVDDFVSEEVGKDIHFTIRGLYRDTSGVWSFTQKSVFLADGRAYNIITRIISSHVDEFGEVAQKIVKTFDLN